MANNKNGAPGQESAVQNTHRNSTSGSHVDVLLSKLDRVRRTGPGCWIACCPARDDKHPSMTIRELDDGRILIHDFGGSTVHEILDAIGMEISDLFPPRQHHGKPERRPFPAMDALRGIAFEALVVSAAASALLAGHPFTAADRERLIMAATRIQAALSAVMPKMKGARHVRT